MRSILALAVLVPSLVQGQSTTTTSVSETIGYQGRLLRSNGTPETGTKEITFTIYGKATEDAPMTQLWSETQTVTLSNGFYAVFLGAKVPFSSAKPGPLFDGRDRWLGVKVGADGELTPRHRIASVAYAIRAAEAATLKGGTVDASSISVNGKSVIDANGALTVPQVYMYSGAFATPNEWEADLIENRNYGRFCQAIGKQFVKAEELVRHFNWGRTNGFFYESWYYVGKRICDQDTHYAGATDPTNDYSIWKYSGKCGCCISVDNWTFETRALIWCQ